MKLAVYSLKKILYQGEAASVNLKTASGEITILDHHRPLISLLTESDVKITDANNKEHHIEAHGGFLEMTKDNTLKLLIEV